MQNNISKNLMDNNYSDYGGGGGRVVETQCLSG